jgi:phosphotransferase system enzyme I (PtsP)
VSKSRDNVELICTVAELGSLFTETQSLDGFLDNVVKTVAEHMHASVCSIYLHEEETDDLVLSANRGLSSESIGNVRLRPSEGITGAAFRELRPICEARASQSPYFKFFPGIQEEEFEAFLAVPIVRGLTRIGVLVVQHQEPAYFDDNDTKALQAISSQLASTIENTKMFLRVRSGLGRRSTPGKTVRERGCPGFVKGQSGGEGIALGPARFYGRLREADLLDMLEAAGGPESLSEGDFERSLAETERQLEDLQAHMEEQAPDLQASLIFNAHILMLKDPAFCDRVRELIQQGGDPLTAVFSVVNELSRVFAGSPNPRLREKVQDINDLGYRLAQNMLPHEEDSGAFAGAVVVAGEELLPSDILKIAAQEANGLVLAGGGLTAHIAILARSLGIPLVVLKDSAKLDIHDGETLLVDAGQGTVHINPEDDVLENYREMQRARDEAGEHLGATEPMETRTRDGERVNMLANINLLSEIELAKQLNAEGIGLYRSEFPYIVRDDFPKEEEQYRIYTQILTEMDGREVVFRTLDVGGDKMLSYFPSLNEANPFLGMRAIRFSLQYRDVFCDQLRAMLRAGAGCELRIMFPFVSSVDDFLAVRKVVFECVGALESEGVPHNSAPLLGVMVELPSAVEIVDELAAESDFLCLGTNDLVQYMLAVDRTNTDIAEYYVPYHPAVLRAIDRVAQAGIRHGKDVSVCGEIAGDPRLIPFLIGCGLRKFSLDARRLHRVRECIAQVDVSEACELRKKMLAAGRISEIRELIGE